MPLDNNIKKMRTQKGVTQEDLAGAIGVSRQTIVAIEKGNYIPSLVLAMDLADFFKVSVKQLFYKK